MKRLFLCAILLFILLLAACSPGAVETPRQSVSTTAGAPAATFRKLPATWTLAPTTPLPPSPTLRPTGSATPTVTATSTATATATFTPAPTIVPPVLQAPFDTLRVVFVADNSLWLWQSGQLATLAAGDNLGAARFSPDGQSIAFARGEELWAVEADGANPRRLLGAEQFATMEPVALGVSLYQWGWIPGTRLILFNTVLNYDQGLYLTDDMHLLNADSGDLSTLALPGTGGLFFVSPDAEQIAYVTAKKISLMRRDGSNRSLLLEYTPVSTYSEYEYYPPLFWKPDASAILVLIPPPDPQNDPNAPAVLWELPADGGAARPLAEFAAPQGLRLFFSPDRARLSYTRPSAENASAIELHIANLDLSGDVLYFTGNVSFVRWLADAEQFLFELNGYLYVGKAGEGYTAFPEAAEAALFWLEGGAYLVIRATEAGSEIWLSAPGAAAFPLAGPFREIGAWDAVMVP